MRVAQEARCLEVLYKATATLDLDNLTLLGGTTDGRLVWHHGGFSSVEEVRARMEAAGFEYLVLDGDEGIPLAGWVHTFDVVGYPAPPNVYKPVPKRIAPVVQLVFVPSEQYAPGEGTSYAVGVVRQPSGRYRTTGCQCKAGLGGRPCKHLYQAVAQATGAFEEAKAAVMQKHSMTAEAFDALYQERCKEIGVSAAMSLVIRAWDHKHFLAELPAQPVAPVKALAAWRKKQAKKRNTGKASVENQDDKDDNGCAAATA